MNKVSTIHLGGRAYQVEEAGYEALKRYIGEAEAKLEGNPDRAEIIADLESAIANKCDTYLTQHKNVVTAADIGIILVEMGPVSQEPGGFDTAQTHAQPKRLYQIREGAMISGVCNGLAAYFDVDVTLVRIVFVLLAVLTSGAFILVYVAMMLLVPHADTPKERAEAYGSASVTAQDLINRAKQNYAEFTDSHEWRRMKKQMREQKRQLKRQWRASMQTWHHTWSAPHVVYRRTWLDEIVGTVIGFFWLAIFVGVIAWGYHHIEAVHLLLDRLNAWLTSLAYSLVNR